MSSSAPDGEDSPARAAARRTETACRHAARRGADALRTVLPEVEAARLHEEQAPAVSGARPADALLAVLSALTPAAHSAAATCHLAAQSGSEAQAQESAAVGDAVVAAVTDAIDALAEDEGSVGAAAARERLAHASAMAAHLGADLLHATGHRRAGSWFQTRSHRPVAFPPSWRAMLDMLSTEVQGARAVAGAVTPPLVEAAAAARHAAANVVSAYEQCDDHDAVGTAACSLGRILALSATYAGLSALDAASLEASRR